MATPLIRLVFKVIMQVAEQFFGDALPVGARELSVRVARFGSFSAEGDVVLIRAVFTVVVTVANLPAENAAPIVTLEPIPTSEFISAFFGFIVGTVTAVVDTVATVFHVDVDVVLALKSLFRTEFPT